MPPAALRVLCSDYRSQRKQQLVVAREVTEDCYIPAGQSIGPFTVEVLDEDGRLVHACLLADHSVRMAVGDDAKILTSAVCSYSEERDFWFEEYDGLRKAGPHYVSFTLKSGDGAHVVEHKIPFTVTPCPEIAYIKTPMPTECFRIGDPFDISLTLMDQFDNPVEKASGEFRSEISSEGMEFSVTHTATIDGEVRLQGVIAIGQIAELSERGVPLVMIEAEVCLWPADSTEEPLFRVKIQLKFKAGVPDTLVLVHPADNEKCVIEKGTLPQFGVRVLDAFGNLVTTAIEPKLTISVVFGEYTATGGRKDMPGEYTLSFTTGPNGSPCLLRGGSALNCDLGEEKEKKLFARLTLVNFDTVKPVLRDIFIQKCAKPSDIRIFCSSEFSPETICEIRNGETMSWTAAQMIRNVSFKMLDEDDNEIAKPNLTMSNFRVSWSNADWVPSYAYNLKSLNSGKLPDIRAPKSDGEVANFSVTFYEASAGTTVKSLSSKTDDSSISFHFSIRAAVGAPVTLCASFSGFAENKIRSAVPLENHIVLHAEDSCGNWVTDITAEDVEALTVVPAAGKLDTEILTKEKGYKAGEIHVKDVRVVFEEDLQNMSLEINFLSLSTVLSVEVMAGLPAKLDWILPKDAEYDGQKRLIVTNRTSAGYWSVQVKDKFSKPTKFSGLIVALGHSKRVDVRADASKPLTNSDGVASFGSVRITAKDAKPPVICQVCRSRCYGTVPVQAKIDFQGLAIIAAPIKIHLKCDPYRISQFVVDIGGTTAESYDETVIACSEIPEFSVSMIAENGSVVTDADFLSSVLMITASTNSPSGVKSFLPPNHVDAEKGTANFQKVVVPYQAGDYAMSFMIKQPSGEEFLSDKYSYKVVAAAPRTFRPMQSPADAWVSNTTDRHKRMIAPSLKFLLEDEFGNIVPDTSDDTKKPNCNGTLNIKVVAGSENTKVIPELESSSLSVAITEGKATTEPLFLAEKTAGENGATYKVTFEADFPDLGVEISEFSISFHFVDDSLKLEQLSHLKGRKDGLAHEKAVLSKDFGLMDREYQHLNQLYATLSDNLLSRQAAIMSQTNGLRLKIKDSTLMELDSLLTDAQSTLSQLTSMSSNDPNVRRVPPAPDQPGVVGRVIHLGRAQSDEDVNVISWLMMQDMKCIVTDTTAKALELAKADKKQQVLSLETVHPLDWDEPMPHETCDPPFKPDGKPVFARQLLYFPDEEKKCRAAFGSLLADAIVVATLEDALSYRQELLQRGLRCPDIATRSGEKITSAGKLTIQSSFGPTDPKIMRFHRVPVRELTECQRKLDALRELHDLAEARDQAFLNLQTFQNSHGLRMKQIGERLAELDHLLKEIGQQELEISRKRPSTNFDSPAFKRFC